jgi:Arc/MetJ-type ribon-helix-helix transcriptional regulator
MGETLVTISLPEELLRSIDRVTRRRGPSRAAVILTACQEYVKRAEERQGSKRRERDAIRQYIDGYRRFPETDPDPNEWTEVYNQWLAEHPKWQQRCSRR